MELNQNSENLIKYSVLPQQFKYEIEILAKSCFLNSGLQFENENTLLESINKGEFPIGSIPLHPDRFQTPKRKELLAWIRAYGLEKQQSKTTEKMQKKIARHLVLVNLDNIKQHELFWEDEVNDLSIIQINPKTTKDYKKILRIITETKNTNSLKLGNLPYLGIEKKNRVCLLKEFIGRPDYSTIKAHKHISLTNCICILLGVENLELIKNKEKQLIEIGIINNFRHTSIVFDIDPQWFKYHDLLNTLKYRDSWNNIISFIYAFLNHLKEDEPLLEKRNPHQRLIFPEPEDSFDLFKIIDNNDDYRFKTLPLIKWAKNSGYKIPDELLSDTIEIPFESESIKNENELTYELEQLLLKYCEEIAIFWKGLKDAFKREHNFMFREAEMHDIKQSAFVCFDDKKVEWLHLKREFIAQENIYSKTEVQKRSSVGKILKNIVRKYLPEALAHPNISTNCNSLYDLFKKLQK